MTARTPIDIEELSAILRDLEAAYHLLRDIRSDPPDAGDYEACNAHDKQVYYLVDRLGEHLAALRRLTERKPGRAVVTETDFAVLLAEHDDAHNAMLQAEAADDDKAADQATERWIAAREAVLSARPSDPEAMAVQLRFLATSSGAGDDPRDRAVIEHVADQLEAIGRAKA